MWEKCLAREVVQTGRVVGFGGFGAGGGGLFCFLFVFAPHRKFLVYPYTNWVC